MSTQCMTYITKVYLDACIQPGRNQNEFKVLADMVDGSALKDKNVIVIADRGYESYNVHGNIYLSKRC